MMPNKMLVDATHPEETRVVVLRGNRVEEFDYESANRKQLRGNIYLAKVTRVEPSLQAAFVEYGGNRHGFLAFSEIHPDYYQIPTADRQALLEDEARAHRDEEDEHERKSNRRRGRNRDRGARRRGDSTRRSEPVADNAAAPVGGDEAAFVANSLKVAAAIGSPDYPIPEAELRAFAIAQARRAYYPPGVFRQLAAGRTLPDLREALRRIEVPTVVIHGAEDPLAPVACAWDVAAHIRSAMTLVIRGMGHDLPPQLYDTFVSVIAANARRAG